MKYLDAWKAGLRTVKVKIINQYTMNRTIKFRAWDKVNNCWLEQLNPQGNPSDNHYINLDGWLWKRQNICTNCSSESDSLSRKEFDLLQYTGLKDNTKWEGLAEDERKKWLKGGNMPSKWTGKEIYEGDIINSNHYPFYGDAPEITNSEGKCKELNYLGVVGIDYDGAYYELHTVSDRVRGGACGSSLSEIKGRCEIIGNIYEHGHLLDNTDTKV